VGVSGRIELKLIKKEEGRENGLISITAGTSFMLLRIVY